MRLTRWSLGLLSLLGFGVAAYLLCLSLAHGGLPPGCGKGSGCDEVLNSRWAKVLGVPVSTPALAVYAAIFVTVVVLGWATTEAQFRRAWSALILLAVVVGGSAIWFVGLQLVVIRAICPWCLAEHGIGLLIGAIVFSRAPFVQKIALKACGAGLVLVGSLALAQTFVAPGPGDVQRLSVQTNVDTGPGADRLISVLDGRLSLRPHELPVLGSADAPKLVVLLFDYCCPHCRATHGYLLNGLAARKKDLAVLLLPAPLNTKCNPYWEETEPRFEHACELARLALAVWRVDPRAFRSFDAWLFDPETPRAPSEARRKAEELTSAAALDDALKDPSIDRQIEQNVTAYHNSGAERLPVIVSPGMRTIVGRPQSEAELFQLLDKELSLRSSDESTFK